MSIAGSTKAIVWSVSPRRELHPVGEEEHDAHHGDEEQRWR